MPSSLALTDLFPGESEMAALMRKHDWAASAIGPVEAWPQSLRTAVSICLASRFPILIWWGPELVKLYNDAYVPMLGDKHPRALGAPGREVWPEIWEIIGPMLTGVIERGEATWSDDQMLPLQRKGFTEECYFTFSYSPIRDEDGAIGGIFTAVAETTERVIGERRLATLRDLAAQSMPADSAEAACAAAARVLAANPHDIPVALLYLVDAGRRQARLVGAAGISAGAEASPEVVDLGQADAACWPLAQVARTGEPVVLETLSGCCANLPGGAWPEPPAKALILPVILPGYSQPAAILVAAASPRRTLDGSYRAFFDLVAGQIAAAIAEARAYEEERRRAEALAELDRAKTAFFSNVSHEFRTPLTLLLGPLQELLGGTGAEVPPAAREQIALAHRNGQRLLKLVNTLLDFARIEAGRMQAVFEPVDLAALTADLASVFRSAIERAGLRLVVDCQPLPEPVYVDPEQWEKIVLNLLSNALKFTFEGEIAVQLTWHGDHATLSVRDTGVGIPADELPRLFERFHRVRNTRGRSVEGSGIGLALVQELVRLHGGTIAVESQIGEGTTFTVSLPAGTAHLPPGRIAAERTQATALGAAPYVEEALRWLPDEPRPESLPVPLEAVPAGWPGAPARGTGGPPARILLADDNADMRDYLVRLLGRQWSVQAVADGEAALAAARAQPPDIVLADVMMPGLDGFALLKALRADPRLQQTPVILLSARAGEEARVEGLEAGADDYLVKPFSARELVARVGAHLELMRVRAEAARREQALREEAERAHEGAERERQRLYNLLMEAPAAICLMQGPEHRFALANPRYRALVGGRELIGRTVREALPEIAGQGFYELLDRVYQTGEPYIGNEQRVLLDRSGSGTLEEVYLNFIYQPTHDAGGRIDGILVHAVEVSEEVRARQEAQRLADENARLYREAQEVLRTRDAFVGAISHDLKSPLTTVLGVTQLLDRRARREPAVESSRLLHSLGIVGAAGTRMLAMVSELVDLSRMQSGQPLELDLSPVDLVAAARRCVEETRQTARQHTIRLSAEVPELVGVWDRPRIERVIANLLSNAVKYSPNGGAVHVAVTREDEGAGWAVLRVSDSGIGIPAAELPHVFERFYRGSNVAGRIAGAGIGLAGAKQIVDQHGGTISVESREGEGTTFTVRLPLAG